MDDDIEMETIFGDGSQQQGGLLGALVGAGKRVLTGESIFMTVFQNRSTQKKKVAFGAPYPGEIIAINRVYSGVPLKVRFVVACLARFEPAAADHRQRRVLGKARIKRRSLAEPEHRAMTRRNLPRVLALAADSDCCLRRHCLSNRRVNYFSPWSRLKTGQSFFS